MRTRGSFYVRGSRELFAISVGTNGKTTAQRPGQALVSMHHPVLTIEQTISSERARIVAPRLLSDYMIATGLETGATWAATSQLPLVLEAESAHPGEVYAPPGGLWVAFNSEIAVACAGLRQLDLGRYELRRLWVEPPYRGSGIGSKLLKECLDWAKKNGATEVVLDVVPTRTRAIEWYRRWGFENTEPFEEIPFEMVYLRKLL